LSAKNSAALEAATAKLSSFLREHPDVNLADAAYTLQVGRNSFKNRRAVLCSSHEEALQALTGENPQRVWTGIASERRSVFFMFPGQGAQYVNMGRGLYESEPVFRAELDRCAELLNSHLGRDIRGLLYPSLEDTEEAQKLLTQTAITQPAIFTVEYALAKLWMEYGIQPEEMIGHSIGEYVAACLAEVMTLEEALVLVSARGRLMQSVPVGAMISVNIGEPEARSILSGDLCLAAVNAPNLCVISGPTAQVNELVGHLEAKQTTFRRLHTSHAFHSGMMDPILKQFRQEFDRVNLRPPKLQFISNLTGTLIRESEAISPDYWVQHLRNPVRFSAGVSELLKNPQAILLEVGPGQALSACVKQNTRKSLGHLVLPSMRHIQEKRGDVETLFAALGRIWVCGRAVRWDSLYKHERRRRISLPTYCFDYQRYWLDQQPPAKELPRSSAENRVTKKADLSDWFYLPSWRRIAPAALLQPITAKQRWCIFLDALGVGEELTRRLRDRGHAVITVEAGEHYESAPQRFVIDPERAEHYQQMWGEVREAGSPPARIAHLWTLSQTRLSARTPDYARHSQTLGFYSLIYLARAMQPSGPAEMILITDNVQEVIGSEELVPENAAILAACNVLPQEYPQLSCRSIDVEVAASSPAELADELLREISAPPAHRYVAHRCGNRWALDFETVRLDPRPESSRLRHRGVYLITGGLGNIGLALGGWLAKAVRARIVLISRTSLPVRSEWDSWLRDHSAQDRTSARIERIQQIESAGGEVLVISADVSRNEDMVAAVQHTLR
jgi:acyl transferase domain-containing protein